VLTCESVGLRLINVCASLEHLRERRMSNDLATFLARKIFELGDDPGDKCQRIEFKGGKWPDNETCMGGICESALVTFLRSRIEDFAESEERS